MNENIIKIFLLKSMAVNFPIICSWGYFFPKILTLIVSEGESNSVRALLRIFEIKERTSFNSDFLFHSVLNQSKSSSIFEGLIKKIREDESGNIGLDLVISEDCILSDPDNIKFFIVLEDSELVNNFSLEDFIPSSSDIETIRVKCADYIKKNHFTKVEEAFIAAAFLLEPFIVKHQKEISLSMILNEISELITEDENLRDLSDLNCVFINELYKYFEKKETTSNHVFDKNDLVDASFTRDMLKNCVFYDDIYFYMSENLFKDICKPIRKSIPIEMIKRQLKDDGIIEINNCSTVTYPVKIVIKRLDGSEEKIRMLRFKTDKTCRTGNLSVIDTLKLNSL